MIRSVCTGERRLLEPSCFTSDKKHRSNAVKGSSEIRLCLISPPSLYSSSVIFKLEACKLSKKWSRKNSSNISHHTLPLVHCSTPSKKWHRICQTVSLILIKALIDWFIWLLYKVVTFFTIEAYVFFSAFMIWLFE